LGDDPPAEQSRCRLRPKAAGSCEPGRVKKSTGTLYWYGGGSDVLLETDLSGGLQNEYIFFGGKRVARRDASGNVFYYFADHLGSSRVVTNATGTVCYEADFYPYGGERAVTTTCPQNYKFTGKERDTETQNDYFGARYYPNNLGRFLSPDPAGLDAADPGNPQTWNMYAYAGNNPLTNVDPEGEDYYLLGGAMCELSPDRCDKESFLVDENGGRVVITDQQVLNGEVRVKVGENGVETITTAEGTFHAQFFNNLPISIDVNGAPGSALAAVGTNLFLESWNTAMTTAFPIAALRPSFAPIIPGGTGNAAGLGQLLALAPLMAAGPEGEAVTPTEGQVAHVTRQLATAGRKSLESSLRSWERSLAEHEAKLGQYRAAGGYTSVVERTINNLKGLIKAARQALGKTP
jgi:RHS repeat-associated protein